MVGRDRLVRCTAALLACLPFGFAPASAGHVGDCRAKALERLRTASPDGYAIYSRVKAPDFFGTWVRCDDAQLDLPTAVHESTHSIAADTDAFPLVGGGEIGRPHEVSDFFPPSRIAKAFATDDFVRIYLRPGKASSSADFLYLLDELNAYTHDLNAAVDLKDMKIPGQSIDHRDGLTAMMAFVAVYAETARAKDPQTWRGLRQPRVAATISKLWDRAEGVLSASCGIPDFGTLDRDYIRRVCASGSGSAIAQVIGRPPACPTACLVPNDDEGQRAAAEDLSDMGNGSAVRKRGRAIRSSVSYRR